MSRLKSMADIIGTSDIKKLSFYKALLAEFIGSMFLVLIGCGSCLGPNTTITRIAFAFGITVATLAQALGHVSGCHINPAVTIGMLVARCVSLIRAVCYIAVQACGAIAGAAILYGLVPARYVGSLGCTVLNEDLTSGQGFGIEMLISFLLVLTVFGVCDERRVDVKGSAPLAIGLAIATAHLFAVPLTGSSMNPTRSLGPAVIMKQGEYWQNHWVYWVGPLSGGLLAGLVYSYIFRESKNLPTTADIDIGKHDRY